MDFPFELRCAREEMKGHILKRIVTRIDFEDIFELPSEYLQAIRKICQNHELTKYTARALYPADFEVNDPVSYLHLAHDYIKDVKCFEFFDEEENMLVEVNQLFIRVTQKVDGIYKNYSFTSKLLNELLTVMQKQGTFKVTRMSILKANEVLFNDIAKIGHYFNENITSYHLYPKVVNWGEPFTQSRCTYNFSVGDYYVNLVQVYDNGLIKDDLYYRLFLELEAYVIEPEEINETIDRLNHLIYCLFENTLSDKGVAVLKKGNQLGDI